MIGGSIRTPDQRLRVFVSSTLTELAAECAASGRLQITPVMSDLDACLDRATPTAPTSSSPAQG